MEQAQVAYTDALEGVASGADSAPAAAAAVAVEEAAPEVAASAAVEADCQRHGAGMDEAELAAAFQAVGVEHVSSAGAGAAQAPAGDQAAEAPATFLDGQVGLGLDVVQIARIQEILERTPSFARRVFTEGERAYCEGRSNPATHFATRFAAKEAVVKALGTGFTCGIGTQDVEVKRTSKGRPYVVLHGCAKEVADRQGIRELPISLSYTHEEAVACAMAITDESERAKERRKDPMAELSKQFKEARTLLGD